jgi:AcrR family transcriptional regulator
MGEETDAEYGADGILKNYFKRCCYMEKKQKRRPDIREVIVDAARDLFSKKGYHNTQVSDLIRFVGMSANTFYAHFKDKKELFEEVATRSLDDHRTTLKKMRETITPDDLKERLEKMSETYKTLFDFIEENPQQMLLIIRGGFGVDEKTDNDTWRYYSYFATDLADDFRKWKRFGFVDGFDPLILGHIVQGMTIQVAYSYLIEKKFSRKKAIEHLIQVNRAILSTYLTEKGKKKLGLIN